MSAIYPENGILIGGRYELTSHLAGGGMGEVWRARDTVLGRAVAVKLLRREYVEQESFRVRFRAEAKHAASTNHQNIAQIYDYGEAAGIAYLVMELVPGEPLSTLLAREEQLSTSQTVEIIAQTAEGLQAAHDIGLVHRDVKPGNILLTPQGEVRITDFGISRTGADLALTKTGEVMGTAQYLSPEQALGKVATAASDTYALAVVAYESLVGRRPFDAESPVATALAHIKNPVPALPENIPAAVAHLVLLGLAKDPTERPATVSLFGQSLRQALSGEIDLSSLAGPPGLSSAESGPQPATSGLVSATPAATPAGAAILVAAKNNRGPGYGFLMGFAAVVLLSLVAVAAVLLPAEPQSNYPQNPPTEGSSGRPTDPGNPAYEPDAQGQYPVLTRGKDGFSSSNSGDPKPAGSPRGSKSGVASSYPPTSATTPAATTASPGQTPQKTPPESETPDDPETTPTASPPPTPTPTATPPETSPAPPVGT